MLADWKEPRRITVRGWRSGRRFAPNFKHRRRILPNPAHQAAGKPHASRPALGGWMQRLKRIFHVGIVRVSAVGQGIWVTCRIRDGVHRAIHSCVVI